VTRCAPATDSPKCFCVAISAGRGQASQKHMVWLRGLHFDDLCSQATFIDNLSEMLLARRAALIAALDQVIPDSRHATTIARLRCFRGIDTLSAAGLCAEVDDWQRFRPKRLSGFLGIVPTEHTSDTKRRQGSITKAGSAHARRLLVEAAHHYRHQPAIGEKLARRGDGQDPRVIEISWRAQRRLHQRWRVLLGQRRKPAGVVTIACARELASFCWEAATLN
jgi:transposase